jgi:hypothetical protein
MRNVTTGAASAAHLLFCGAGDAGAGLADSLSSAQRSELDKGELVVESKNIPGGAWPQLTVYTIVAAPLDVVEDLLSDYKSASTYNPGLVSAKVVATPSPDVKDVEYTEKMPIVGMVSYTVRNTYTYDGNGGLTIAWNLLSSPVASESTGSITVEPFEKGTLLRYVNYVKPKSSLAALAKGAALGSVKKTVLAIKQEAETRAKAAAGATQ